MKGEGMKKKDVKELYYREIGKAVCDAWVKAMSHPYIKLDMCPDFDNMIILVYGRFLYRFMKSKKAEKLFKKLEMKQP